MTVHDLVNAVTSGNIDHMLKSDRDPQELGFLNRRAMIINAAEKFSRQYPLRDDIQLFLAPVKSDFSLKFGDLSISANRDTAVVIIAFHDESTMNVSAGDLREVLDTDPDSSTVNTGNFLSEIAEKYSDLHGFDMLIEGGFTELNGNMISSVIESVLDTVSKKITENLSADPELFLAGYSLCVTEICDSAISDHNYICAPPANLTEEEFYSRLPELKKEMSSSELLDISRGFRNIRRSEHISEAVRRGDTEGFFRLIENISVSLVPDVELAIDLSKRLLQGDGAAFAVQNSVAAFVPTYTAVGYANEMKRVFGNCSVLRIGNSSAIEIII